jgi:methyltransferase (TIGR00027 family)
MQPSRPSLTAIGVASRRAAHQLFDSPLVFPDPLAVAILGPDAGSRLRQDAQKHFERPSIALRAFVVARARVAEDEMTEAALRGVRQFVILGAGLDTFAYRNPATPVRVFEVDHPATQLWKRDALAAAGIGIPSSLTFAPVDFERQTLGDALSNAGFDASSPALFSWLGVTMYLTGDAFDSTLAFVASRPTGTAVVFDYAMDPALLTPPEQQAFSRLEKRVAEAGEPFRTFVRPADLSERLAAAGFVSVEDLGASELNAGYFAGRADNLRVSSGAGRLVVARR